ncbi:MAG: hypothetical protein AB7L76_02980 [Burkholderiaceae bacterium]
MSAFDWLQSHPIAYPALEAMHIFGLATLVGSLLLFELRVLGLGGALPPQPLARLALPLTLAGFALAAISGGLMFASQPLELIGNRAFVLKMGLLALAGINAALFHARGGVQRLDTAARAQAVFSMLLWLAVIICGRWIAYI